MDNIKPQKSLAVKEMAAQYREAIKIAGGSRAGYLKNFEGKHISTATYKWHKNKPMVVFTSFLAAFLGYYVSLFFTSGFTAMNIVYVLICSMLAFAHARNMITLSQIHKKKNDIARTQATYFEPEALWNVDYPVTGEKGELITAIVSARKCLGLLESATTLPIHVSSREPYYCQMVMDIMNSQENDISPYIYNEVNYLCDSTKSYMISYSSMIDLNIELQRMNPEARRG